MLIKNYDKLIISVKNDTLNDMPLNVLFDYIKRKKIKFVFDDKNKAIKKYINNYLSEFNIDDVNKEISNLFNSINKFDIDIMYFFHYVDNKFKSIAINRIEYSLNDVKKLFTDLFDMYNNNHFNNVYALNNYIYSIFNSNKSNLSKTISENKKELFNFIDNNFNKNEINVTLKLIVIKSNYNNENDLLDFIEYIKLMKENSALLNLSIVNMFGKNRAFDMVINYFENNINDELNGLFVALIDELSIKKSTVHMKEVINNLDDNIIINIQEEIDKYSYFNNKKEIQRLQYVYKYGSDAIDSLLVLIRIKSNSIHMSNSLKKLIKK